MCRLIRVPPALDKGCRPLQGHVHWDHVTDFRLLVVALACLWGRRQVAHGYRDLEAAPHRTRCTNFGLGERWAPEAARRQPAQALVRRRHPGTGDTLSVVLEAAKQATRGQGLDAGAQMQAPGTEADRRGHQDVGAMLGCRHQVLPWGGRLSGTPEQAKTLGLPVRKPTEWAAQLSREFKAPAGVKVVGRWDAYDRWRPVVQAGREQPGHVASPRTGHRRLFTPGWPRQAGR